MYQSHNNPARNPAISGKACRFVCNTSCVRQVHLDPDSDAALTLAKTWLHGTNAQDKPSDSLVIRHALRRYHQHLRTILADPRRLEAERLAVRACGSRMPRGRKRAHFAS